MALARELDALGHRNRVLALSLGFDGRAEPGIPALTSRTDETPLTIILAARALRRALRRDPADVVIAHGGRAVEAAVTVRRQGRPIIVWQRILGFPPSIWHPLRRRYWHAVVRRVDAAFALTPDLEEELRRLGFGGPVWVVPNFRDPSAFAATDRGEARRELHEELAVPDGVPLVGFVGHLVEQKRPDRAVDVIAAVHRRGEEARLVVAGDGPLRDKLEREVAGRRLQDSVHLLGPRDDIARILAGIDVFILTSDAEGQPGVLIEAAMAGCPIVAVPAGNVRDVVEAGTGIVTERIDAEEVATRVVELLRDASERRRLGDEARRRSERFSASRIAPVYAARLAGLVSPQGATG